jgi:GMP synthase-like glutamine amidotransferase
MKALALQHAPFEGLGSIRNWIDRRDAEIGVTRLFLGEVPLSPEGIDLIIVMGGPMSVNDEDTFPWLRSEKRFISDAVARGTPVLGICLGAQLIAASLGARVFPNPVKEIGWFPVRAVPGTWDSFRFPAEFTAFHWHGETFDLPSGATRLAESTACRNQAFQIGRAVIGLQFHLEATPGSAADMVKNCAEELVPDPWIQSAADMETASAAGSRTANPLMDEVLSYLME